MDDRVGEADVGEGLLADAEEWLDTSRAFEGCLQRPVGETIARLCRVLGLDPDWCVEGGEGWTVGTFPFSLPPRDLPPRPPRPDQAGDGPDPGAEPRNALAPAATGPPG